MRFINVCLPFKVIAYALKSPPYKVNKPIRIMLCIFASPYNAICLNVIILIISPGVRILWLVQIVCVWVSVSYLKTLVGIESAGVSFSLFGWHLLEPFFPVLGEPDQSHYPCSSKRMGQRAGRRERIWICHLCHHRGLVKICCCFLSIMELIHHYHLDQQCRTMRN